jgi:hypothetical protein
VYQAIRKIPFGRKLPQSVKHSKSPSANQPQCEAFKITLPAPINLITFARTEICAMYMIQMRGQTTLRVPSKFMLSALN